MNMVRLFFSLLHLNQLVEFDELQVVLIDEFVCRGQQVVVSDHVDFLVVRNDRLVIVLAQLVDLRECLSDEEESMLSVEFLLLIYESENEYVVLLGPVVHL